MRRVAVFNCSLADKQQLSCEEGGEQQGGLGLGLVFGSLGLGYRI